MEVENKYKWTDNPTVSGVSKCDTDILNDCLMHLKYEKSSGLHNIGEIVTSTIPLNDAGLHLLDGSLIENGVYSAFIDYMAKIFVTNPKLFCTQEEYDQSIADYGVCGKYVYNIVEKTIRLPKVSGFIEGTLDETKLGDIVEAGLPNITGSIGKIRTMLNNVWSASGAFTRVVDSVSGDANNGNAGTSQYVFDASNSNPIYGKSLTVQPQSTQVYLYIVLATTTKTDIEVNVDNVITDLNSKADKDLANVTTPAQSFKDMYVGWGMPDYSRAINNIFIKPTPTIQTYIAPANGFVAVSIQGKIGFVNLVINNVILTNGAQLSGEYGWSNWFVPVNKGDTITFYSNASNYVTNKAYFIYAKGEAE